ncbi:MAG TPA: hypothetical protein VM513_18280 [Kofleriaceae bacterium]|jgi:hypothetical protein|nr:hypothetical protein [Kofleriaceae bacterium]
MGAVRLLAASVLFAGCTADLDAPRTPAELDRVYFDCKVQPVLAMYCGQLACHGDPARYFRVYSRNRLRDGGDETQRNVFMRDTERAHNYEAARAFVDLERPEASLLLRKPLEQAAGGAFHRGATLYGGGNVFRDTADPDYQTIARWINGATEDPTTCIEPGSTL